MQQRDMPDVQLEIDGLIYIEIEMAFILQCERLTEQASVQEGAGDVK